MEDFYRYIAAGEDKGSALRHAQLDLIKQFADQAMPFYWAGFIMVGDGSRSIPISPHRVKVAICLSNALAVARPTLPQRCLRTAPPNGGMRRTESGDPPQQ